MLFIFSTSVLIRHLWQLKTVVFLHWGLICAILLLKQHLSEKKFYNFDDRFETSARDETYLSHAVKKLGPML